MHRRHRHQECLTFLQTIQATVPAELEVHLIGDNSATHNIEAITTWLLHHPVPPALHANLRLLAGPGRAVVRRVDDLQAIKANVGKWTVQAVM